MSENDFMKQQQAAVERMREMNARAAKSTGAGNMPPVPPFVRVPRQENAARTYERAKRRRHRLLRRKTAAYRGFWIYRF